ncbi:hypothetical protein LI174_23360, partial [[Clostridium] symbiosum]|nr:hypothetical protein [[Clostridium] symbiosum]
QKTQPAPSPHRTWSVPDAFSSPPLNPYADMINNQLIVWKDVPLLLIFNLVLFVPFIFTKEFRGPEKKVNSL